MSIQRYNKYQYETSPRKLEPEYDNPRQRYPKKSSAPQRKVDRIARQKAVMRKRDRAKIVFAVMSVFLAIFTIMWRSARIDELYSKNEKLKEEYLSIEKENGQMKVDIENTLNLNNIEQQAKELLGMQKLSNKQTIYVSLPKKDYIQPANENVESKENQKGINKILEKIKNIF